MNLSQMTPEELAKKWQRLCCRHDSLVDLVDIGDDRIYFAGKDMEAIEREFKRRGLNYHEFIK